MIHDEALASKTLELELMKVLKRAIKLVNTIKSSALSTRLLRREQINADYHNLCYDTEVRWLPKSNFALQIELTNFFMLQNKEELVKSLQEDVLSLV